MNEKKAKPRRATLPRGLFHLWVDCCAVSGGTTSPRTLSSSSDEARPPPDRDCDSVAPPPTTRRDSSRRDLPGVLRLSSNVSDGLEAESDGAVRGGIVMVCVVVAMTFERGWGSTDRTTRTFKRCECTMGIPGYCAKITQGRALCY